MSELIKYKKIINNVYFNQCSFDNRLNVFNSIKKIFNLFSFLISIFTIYKSKFEINLGINNSTRIFNNKSAFENKKKLSMFKINLNKNNSKSIIIKIKKKFKLFSIFYLENLISIKKTYKINLNNFSIKQKIYLTKSFVTENK